MKRVLTAGNCGFDHQAISRFLRANWNVQVDQASTLDDAIRTVSDTHYDLVLVNRVFDSDGGSGLTLVERLANEAADRKTPSVLLTSFPDVQSQAIQAGAMGSFGKRELNSDAARQLICDVLGVARTSV